jgi:hypothetical protein
MDNDGNQIKLHEKITSGILLVMAICTCMFYIIAL